MSSKILKYFSYEHLPKDLQKVSKPFNMIAYTFEEALPDCAEKTAMFRKLLEAKDCAVRAYLEKGE